MNQFFGRNCTNYNDEVTPIKETIKRQTCITDTFKERKRRSTNLSDKTESKEKKKRDNAIIENFKYLKETFETASKNIQGNINISRNLYKLPNCTNNAILDRETVSEGKINEGLNYSEINTVECIDSDDNIDNKKIDIILAEIENEMYKNKVKSIDTKSSNIQENLVPMAKTLPLPTFHKESECTAQQQSLAQPKSNYYKTAANTKNRIKTPKSNYSFLELLERNLDLSDEEESNLPLNEHSRFSETIKNQIDDYMQKAENKVLKTNANIQLLLENENTSILNNNTGKKEAKELHSEEALSPTQKVYPHYKIIEILDGNNITKVPIKKIDEIENKKCTIESSQTSYGQSITELGNKYLIDSYSNSNVVVQPDKQNTPSDTSNNCLQANFNETGIAGLCLIGDKTQRQLNVHDVTPKQEYQILQGDTRRDDNTTIKQILPSLASDSRLEANENIIAKLSSRESQAQNELNQYDGIIKDKSNILYGDDIPNKNISPSFTYTGGLQATNLTDLNITTKNAQSQLSQFDYFHKQHSTVINENDITTPNSDVLTTDNTMHHKMKETNVMDLGILDKINIRELNNLNNNNINNNIIDIQATNVGYTGHINTKLKTPSHTEQNKLQINTCQKNVAEINITTQSAQNQTQNFASNNETQRDYFVSKQMTTRGNDILETDLQIVNATASDAAAGRSETTRHELKSEKPYECTDIVDNCLHKQNLNTIQRKDNQSVVHVVDNDLFKPRLAGDPAYNRSIFLYNANRYTKNSIKTVNTPLINCSEDSLTDVTDDCLESNLNISSNNVCSVYDSNNSFIKKYTYSATKLGIFTKETPIYRIQLTKKVQMDLNITKIISDDYRPQSYGNYLNKSTLENINKTKHFGGIPVYNNIQCSSHDNHQINTFAYKEQTTSFNSQENKIQNMTPHQQANSEISAKEKGSVSSNTDNNLKQDSHFFNNSHKYVKNSNANIDNIVNMDNVPISSKIEEILALNKNITAIEDTKDKNNLETGHNKLQDILKKYSKILSCVFLITEKCTFIFLVVVTLFIFLYSLSY